MHLQGDDRLNDGAVMALRATATPTCGPGQVATPLFSVRLELPNLPSSVDLDRRRVTGR